MKTYEKRFELLVPSETDYLGLIRKFVVEVAHLAGFSPEESDSIELAVDEACANVIEHAYERDSKKQIDVKVEYNHSKFVISVIDTGKRFNPKDFESTDIRKRLEEHKRGGYGMHIMRQLMDEVEYEIGHADKNQVRMVKYLPTGKKQK